MYQYDRQKSPHAKISRVIPDRRRNEQTNERQAGGRPHEAIVRPIRRVPRSNQPGFIERRGEGALHARPILLARRLRRPIDIYQFDVSNLPLLKCPSPMIGHFYRGDFFRFDRIAIVVARTRDRAKSISPLRIYKPYSRSREGSVSSFKTAAYGETVLACDSELRNDE